MKCWTLAHRMMNAMTQPELCACKSCLSPLSAESLYYKGRRYSLLIVIHIIIRHPCLIAMCSKGVRRGGVWKKYFDFKLILIFKLMTGEGVVGAPGKVLVWLIFRNWIMRLGKYFFTNQVSHLKDWNYIKLNYNSTATLWSNIDRRICFFRGDLLV